MNLKPELKELYSEWKNTRCDSLDALCTFVAHHSELPENELQNIVQFLLPDLFGIWYRSENRMSVSRFLRLLSSREESFFTGLNTTQLTENCLEVQLRNSEKKQSLEDLSLAYPLAGDFLKRFSEENPNLFEEPEEDENLDDEDENYNEDSGSQKQTEQLVYSGGENVSISENYDIHDLIGKGGQKEVHTVTQQSTGQKLALKVPFRESAQSELIGEAQIQAILSHQGVPAVYSLAFGTQAPPILVERYIEGEDWASCFQQMTQEENLSILEKTSRILASAHREHHIIHGDLKPLNVKVNREYNEVYLVDWGLAIRLDHKPVKWAPQGTIDYLPPEIARGDLEAVCAATDVFMLGAILYHILSGTGLYSNIYCTYGPFFARSQARKAQWNPLPESGPYGTIPQELAAITYKALAKNPADRYADAADFADALEKYRLRAKLFERFAKAKTEEAELRKKNEKTNSDHHSQALLLAGMIGNGNEFSLIRHDLAEMEKGDETHSDFLREVFSEELTARQLLLEKTIVLKDYAQATAQLETGRQSLAEFHGLYGNQTKETPSFITERMKGLQRAEQAIQAGLVARKREYMMKWVVLASVLFTLLIVCFGIYLKAEYEAKEKRQAILSLNIQTQKMISLAEVQYFGQGKLAIESSLYEVPSYLPRAWQQECTLHTSLLPVQCASGAENILSVTFSPNEQYFLGRTSDQYLICWETKNGKQVSRKKAPEIAGISQSTLYTNPCFRNSEATDPWKSSEFLLFSPKGLLVCWNHTGDSNRSFWLDLIRENPEQFPNYDAVTLGKPVFYREGNAQRMAVGNQEGKVLFFSLPDGKLLKQVQAHEKKIVSLCISRDQKHLASSGEDGLYRYWKTDGTTAEKLELPLSTEPHPDYGYWRPLDISPDGKRLAAGIESGEILVWDLQNKKVIAQMQEKPDAETRALMIQQIFWLDDFRLLTTCPNGFYRIWNLTKMGPDGIPESTNLQTEDSLPKFGIRTAAISSSRQKLILAENNFLLSLFDLNTKQKELISDGYLHFASNSGSLPVSPVWHPGLNRILVGGTGYHPLLMYDPGTMKTEVPAALQNQPMQFLTTGLDVPREGTRFVLALVPFLQPAPGILQCYEGNPPSLKRELKTSADTSRNNSVKCAISPDGTRFVETTDEEHVLRFRDWETGEVLRTLEIQGTLLNFCFGNDGLFFTISRTKELEVILTRWNQDGLAGNPAQITLPYPVFPENHVVPEMVLSNDGKTLALGFMNGEVLLVECQDFNIKIPLDFSEPLYCLQNNLAKLLETRRGSQFSFSKVVTGIRWSANDELMAISFSSGKSVLVETKSFSVIAAGYCGDEVISLHDYRIIRPVFTGPDHLFTFGSDGAVYQWNFVPSPEQPEVLKTRDGASKIRPLQNDLFVGLLEYNSLKNPFFIFQGNQEIFHLEEIQDFEVLNNTPGAETFLLLKKDGTLMAVNKKGEPVDIPFLKARNVPQGATAIYVHPDLTFAVVLVKRLKQAKYIYVTSPDSKKEKLEEFFEAWQINLKDSEPIWTRVEIPFSEDEFLSVGTVNFVPGSPEMQVANSNPDPRFYAWNLEEKKPVRKSSLGQPDFLIKGDELLGLYTNSNLVVTRSGKYILQTGMGHLLAIWDGDTLEMVQKIPINLPDYEKERTLLAVAPLDRGFGEWENEDAFVVSGADGILRFYQYIPAEKRFVNVYVLSPLQLRDFMQDPRNLPNRSFHLVSSGRFTVESLALSPNGRKLYVGTADEVRTYSMDEIRRNIAGLKKKWANTNVEELTSLRFDLDHGVQSIHQVFLKPWK